MMEHDIKALPEYFQAIKRGDKPFELRKDDRPYSAGDSLLLREWDGDYTGAIWRVRVTYTLRGGEWLAPGYVALGVRAMAEDNALQVQEDFRKSADRLRAERDELARQLQAAEQHAAELAQRVYGLERQLDAATSHRMYAMLQRARWQARYEVRRSALLAQIRRLRRGLTVAEEAQDNSRPTITRILPSEACPRCGHRLDNLSPGISVVSGGIQVCTSCLNQGETEIARAKGVTPWT